MSWNPPQQPDDQNPYGQPGYGQQPGVPPYGQQPGVPPYGQQPGVPPYGGQQPGFDPYAQQPGGYPQAGFGGPPVNPSEEKTWGMLSHLGSLIAICVLTFFNFVVPLVIYLIYKDRSPFIRHHASQALNLTLTGLVYGVIGTVIAILTCGVGAILLVALFVAQVVYLIMGAVAANRGEWYRYPQWIAYPMFT